MKRRNLLAGAAGLGLAPLARSILPAPALAAPARARTLVFVPQANLTSLDPIWTTATVTRNYSFLVYDTLYGLDADLQPHPQMAEGHTVDQDGLRWTVRLRDGLFFHDGSPVLAKDCTASLARWMKRDSMGQTLADRLAAMETPDDRTIVFRLKKSFAPLPFALAKTQPSPPVIMPARIAETDPYKQITEAVGSRPVPLRQGGIRLRQPRRLREIRQIRAARGGAELLRRRQARAGRAHRVEDHPGSRDPGATRSDRARWTGWRCRCPDLLPMLRRDSNIVVEKLDPIGLYPVLRFNHLQGPTANLGLRQAILACIDQREVMQAIMGDDASAYHVPVGCFIAGTASASDAAIDRLGGHKSEAELKAMVQASGYKGEPVLLMHPDRPALLRRDDPGGRREHEADRHQRGRPARWTGARSCSAAPASSRWTRAAGRCSAPPSRRPIISTRSPPRRSAAMAARPGSAGRSDAKVEALREQWIDSSDAAEEKRLAAEIQQEVLTQALYVPLGQYFQSAAWRKTVTGHLKGPVPVFWNVQKA